MTDRKLDKFFSTADRPLECGECKKQITVRYTEIVEGTVTHINMCADCPELQRRLNGMTPGEQGHFLPGQAGLECGGCGTTLEDVKRGHRLGCMECYDVFGDLILSEMQTAGKIPHRVLVNIKKSHLIHIGRAPGESLSINPASRLLALNEALSETLTREDYEQAALLRDQIRALTENEEKQVDKEKTDEPNK